MSTSVRIALVGAGRIGAVHATNLTAMSGVEVLIADADADRARRLAADVGAVAADAHDLLRQRVDGLVVAAATDAHAEWVLAAVDAGIPTFCEKPVAPDATGTRAVLDKMQASATPVQIGFQRRFDPGYRAARGAVRSGRLGYLHTMRAGTLDAQPPPAAYVASSGGIFRDCSVHDFDVVRWVGGHDVAEVYATGANRGAAFFDQAGDVDAAAALLTLTDGTLVHVMAGRYNAAGYDVRLELLGSRDSMSVGLDDRMPLRSAEMAVQFPAGPAHVGFMQRFEGAYAAELVGFVDVIAGRAEPECTIADALEAILVAEACELSRAERRPVAMSEVRG